MKHLIDKVCLCKYCTMLDCMFGDPLLNAWEKKFVKSVARQGWICNYSQKQKAVIKRTFKRQQQKYEVKK